MTNFRDIKYNDKLTYGELFLQVRHGCPRGTHFTSLGIISLGRGEVFVWEGLCGARGGFCMGGPLWGEWEGVIWSPESPSS